MKDEIKEILSNMLHIIIKYGDDFDDLEENEIRYQLSYKQMEKLYDYITNLQEENKNLKQINEEHRRINGELRKENKHIFANVNDDQLLRSNAMNYAELQDYKTRNEKAINCINHYATENDDYSKLYSTEEEELLEILQGKSDE